MHRDQCSAMGVSDERRTVLTNAADFDGCRLVAENGLSVRVLSGGCIHAIEYGEILINQVLAGPMGGGIHRLILRIDSGDGFACHEIIGPDQASAVTSGVDRVLWSRTVDGIRCECTCWVHPSGEGWFFHIEVANGLPRAVRADLLMVQDVGLATRGQVRNNELFTSQYLDHAAVKHAERGYVVMTRQNLPQSPGETHPWLMQGCFPAAVGFTTDGFDFFSAEHRGSGGAAALGRPVIGRLVRQYETGYIAIQSSPMGLQPGGSDTRTFFAHFLADHPMPTAATDVDRLSRVSAMRADLLRAMREQVNLAPMPRHVSLFQTAELLAGEQLSADDLTRWFGSERRHEEIDDGTLLSFFHGEDARHVVLKAKELSVARPHGHILRAGRGVMPDEALMSCTFYASGVFASQLTLGNTSLAKMLSGVRDPLNIVRSSGLRLFVRCDPSQPWRLLGAASAFEMALQECRWIYKCDGEWLTVRCRATDAEPVITFDLQATGKPVEWLICGEIAAGPAEFENSPSMSVDAEQARITIRPDPKSLLGERQPGITFRIAARAPANVGRLGGDELLFEDHVSRRLPYVTMQTRPTPSFTFSFSGELDDQRAIKPLATSWQDLTAGVRLRSASQEITEQIQDALRWFARDAMIHLSCPRGLEQANGGAWGVRDVCQGPVEFLLSYGRSGIVADILRRLFAQQYHVRGDWPQWFMFPPFESIQSRHCHGDVLIWPLKALCDYLEDSDDESILRERLPYTDELTFQPTDDAATMLEHVDRVIAKIERNFLPGIALPRFGDGDWDDSLQPADAILRERMVSSWTSALMFQTLRRYANAMAHFGEGERAAKSTKIADAINEDFHRHLMPDGIVAGFAVFNAGGPVEYLLHPSDTRTGLRHRLIPMSRGIISGIFSRAEAQRHLDLIHEHLLFPDGARLMDRPTKYEGGRERTFRRAESAAFFGREIGLQYVHAHLRYAEALAVMGRGEELLHALRVVNPIAVTQVVPGARRRQRNCYFSSSDAVFGDRYDAAASYARLRDGDIPTDGGWRIYSSGPGIYTGIVMRQMLGIRRHFDWIEFDPVLSNELNGLCCQLTDGGRQFEYRFAKSTTAGAPKRVTVNGRPIDSAQTIPHPYRPGGVRCRRSEFQSRLTQPLNLVQIEI
ncbi:MAG TPA: hypothetical protein VLI90_03465 [Tepidisphaeraceae bacterium]|nr:hypothetical protein [Tepidisphaeraceae bacterium]